MQQRVFVEDAKGQPLMPTHPARARRLLRDGRARVLRRSPFTIRLDDRRREASSTQPITLKVDPGSVTSGMALVAAFERGPTVVWAGELTHRSRVISQRLADRRALRRGRRGRNSRHRKPRFNNRRRSAGWLAPSLRSRIEQTESWARRLCARAPVAHIAVETVRFDVHALAAGRSLEGVDYQHGTLAGWELRAYLLHRHQHTCAYCNGVSGDPVLEVEHVHPRGRGGSDRVSNLVVACRSCNEAKGKRSAGEWAEASGGRTRLERTRRAGAARVAAGERPSLRDAAAINATRYATGRALQRIGVAVAFYSGGRTRANRAAAGYPKAHWIDAACVGDDGDRVRLNPCADVLSATATGRGSRQVCAVDRYGFPRGRGGRIKRIRGVGTGDTVRLEQLRGRYAGTHTGAVRGIRADGRVDVATRWGKVTAPVRRVALIARADGYEHATIPTVTG